MWQVSGPMMYDLLALLNGALCSRVSHMPPFYWLVDSEGQESSTNPTAGLALAMPRWGRLRTSCFPESWKQAGGCCVKAKHPLRSGFLYLGLRQLCVWREPGSSHPASSPLPGVLEGVEYISQNVAFTPTGKSRAGMS